MGVTRRSLLLGAGAAAFIGMPVSYAGIRVVRGSPGSPERPEIIVPAGYELQYPTPSRAEFTAFVAGPPSPGGIQVVVRWPGQRIRAVVAGDRRLPLNQPGGDASTALVTLPVVRSSAGADSPTVQVWSTLTGIDTGINWLVAHNDPDRAAGYWAATAWPAGEVKAVLTLTAACSAVLRDSGLAEAARQRGHFFQLEGFETNNPLHWDNPPHWHLSYYPGPTTTATPATIPHFWLDDRGRTFYNGQDVSRRARATYHANQPAPIRDGAGTLILTTVIRPDGGLDIQVPGGPAYAITSASGDYTGPVDVLRAGAPWRTIATDDRVNEGRMTVDGAGYAYDELTGILTG